MPSLINNANDRKYRGARQKALATIGGAVRNITVTEGIGNAVDAEDFVENHLRKQIKILKTCDVNNLKDCGIADSFTWLTEPKKKINMPKKIGDLCRFGIGNSGKIDVSLQSYGFVMSNGYSVNLFYVPNCSAFYELYGGYIQDTVCVNAIYDMNGLTKPNEVGKDIGVVTVLYSGEKTMAVAPDLYKIDAERSDFIDAPQICSKLDKNLDAPNLEEVIAMFYNSSVFGMVEATGYLSTTTKINDSNASWVLNFYTGMIHPHSKGSTNALRCIRR